MEIFFVVFRDLLTLYMLIILLRWFGPWLSLDLEEGRLRWIPPLADPLIGRLRKILPPMGPVDFGPIAALVTVWLVRELGTAIMLSR